MGKFDKLAQFLGKKSQNITDELVKSGKKIPYSIVTKDGESILKSPKAEAILSMRDPDTVEMLDPEMVEFLGENPAYLEHLEAEKGYGAKALKAIEENAKRRGIDSIYLNASPVGGTRGLTEKEAAKKVKEFYEKNGYKIAKDEITNTMMYKKLMGLSAVPVGSQVVDMNPLQDIKAGLGYYEKAKEAITKPLASQLNIGKNPKDEAIINEALKLGLDPVNYIPGAAGVAAGAVQMLTPSDEEMAKINALKKMRGY